MTAKAKVLFMMIAVSCVSADTFGASPPDVKEVLVPRALYQPFFKDQGETERYIGPLEVDKDPVTNDEYLAFVRKNPQWQRSKIKRIFASRNYLEQWNGDESFSKEIAPYPVTNVSWFSARKYCEDQGKRLLTVAEWEHASDSQNQENVQLVLNWYGKPNGSLSDIKSAKVNSLGLRGMHGLIWEWVEDFGSVIIQGDSRNSNDTSGTLFCGAGALRAKDPSQYATFMRFAHRSSLKAGYVGSTLGFRCARDLSSTDRATNPTGL